MKLVKPLLLVFATMVMTSSAFAENYNDRFISETAPLIAFTNARVIDGTGAAAKEKQTVVIENGRIIKVGRDGEVSIPEEAKRISLKGKSLLPGWVMTHEHIFYATHPPKYSPNYMSYLSVQQSIAYPRLYLAAGVTSARTAGSTDPYSDLGIKRAIDSGDHVGPDFDLTTPFVTFSIPGLNYLNRSDIKTEQGAREMVRYWASRGFTSVKVQGITSEEQRSLLAATIDESHKYGLKITGDFGSSIAIHRMAVDLGIDQLEHMIAHYKNKQALTAEDPEVQGMMQHYVDHSLTISTTMALWDDQIIPDEVFNLLTDYSQKLYRRYPFGEWGGGEDSIKDGSALKQQQALYLAFYRKGGTLSVGTDPARQGVLAGYGNLRSLELLADAGIPALDVIKMATLNGAKVIGIEQDRGTIEVGKRADLIVIAGNPLENIADVHKIETVYKKGIGYDPQALKDSVKGAVGGPG